MNIVDKISTMPALQKRWSRGEWRKRRLSLHGAYFYDRYIGDKRHAIITEEEYLFRKLEGTLECYKTHLERCGANLELSNVSL